MLSIDTKSIINFIIKISVIGYMIKYIGIFNKTNDYLPFILALLIVLVFEYFGIPKNSKEGFALSPNKFPESDTNPILAGDYPLLDNPVGYSNLSYSDLWRYYPSFNNSYDQVTNNVRYWATPNNGKCVRAEICGGLYDNKNIEIPPPPPIIPFSSPDKRVNYYAAEPMVCPYD